ncbi:ABC-type dipeptide/oligopeptide/nickel transport system ATPase subunit [Microbacterium trichothecenolyticum]|uniref:ABC-type dipeptide/oligopeptide/nickel transport system ATPase subunit n=1 Tax=Microbacterium trichothecenolyticum TaxID=69370 RepID=A0ABU0TPF5_MICTR|nr:ABC-type dipeptide/oligopeptide/nickel transport system ATPase subunit [Microbacterium trichothecenolyticum]
MPAALTVAGVSAAHGRGRSTRTILTPTDLAIRSGESLAVVGRSGAGKSTLAEIVLALRRPRTGTVSVDGTAWCSPRHTAGREHRHLVQGVAQDAAAAFVPGWTLRRSMADAVHRLTGMTDRASVDRAIHRACDLASLDHGLLARRPAEVSGGQAQRAAIARALAVDPVVLVADEPTSALDPRRAADVSRALVELARSTGLALLLVTHDPAVASRCDRTLTLTAPAAA